MRLNARSAAIRPWSWNNVLCDVWAVTIHLHKIRPPCDHARKWLGGQLVESRLPSYASQKYMQSKGLDVPHTSGWRKKATLTYVKSVGYAQPTQVPKGNVVIVPTHWLKGSVSIDVLGGVGGYVGKTSNGAVDVAITLNATDDVAIKRPTPLVTWQ